MTNRRRLAAVLIAALCATMIAPATQAANPTQTGQLLRAANQLAQWIECSGPTPTPESGAIPATPQTPPGRTVVLVAGLGASHQYWSSVRAQLLPTTRVCWYDRPGLGISARRLGARKVSAVTHATELDALLSASGEAGPFVIVGHSYGGLLARAYGQNFAARTAGMVLVDASYSTQWQGAAKFWGEAGSLINMKKTQNAVYGRPQLGQKPLVVIGAGRFNSSRWQTNQVVMSQLGTNSVHVTAVNQSHVIMASNPAIVTEGIKEVAEAAAKDQNSLTPCSINLAAVWAPLGGICGRRR